MIRDPPRGLSSDTDFAEEALASSARRVLYGVHHHEAHRINISYHHYMSRLYYGGIKTIEYNLGLVENSQHQQSGRSGSLVVSTPRWFLYWTNLAAHDIIFLLRGRYPIE